MLSINTGKILILTPDDYIVTTPDDNTGVFSRLKPSAQTSFIESDIVILVDVNKNTIVLKNRWGSIGRIDGKMLNE